MKAVVAVVLALCLCHVHGWSQTRRSLRQDGSASATLNIQLSNTGSVKAGSHSQFAASSSASVSSTDTLVAPWYVIQDVVYASLSTLFTTASNALNSASGKGDKATYCPSAYNAVEAEATAAVSLQAEAWANSISCAQAVGDASVTATGHASAKARAEAFIDLIIQAAVSANVGVNTAEATAVVQLQQTAFVEAFALAATTASVDGTGSACSKSFANASIAVDALARIAINLVASVDCNSSYLHGDAVSSTEFVTTETTSFSGGSGSASGSAVDIGMTHASGTSAGFDG